jgi:hypothetical protein
MNGNERLSHERKLESDDRIWICATRSSGAQWGTKWQDPAEAYIALVERQIFAMPDKLELSLSVLGKHL